MHSYQRPVKPSHSAPGCDQIGLCLTNEIKRKCAALLEIPRPRFATYLPHAVNYVIVPTCPQPRPRLRPNRNANPSVGLAFISGLRLRQRLDATRADFDFAHAPADQHPTLLHASIPATLDMSLRKADMIAKLWALAADFTSSHSSISDNRFSEE